MRFSEPAHSPIAIDSPPQSSRRKRARIEVQCEQCRGGRRRCDGARPRCYGCDIRDLLCSFATKDSPEEKSPEETRDEKPDTIGDNNSNGPVKQKDRSKEVQFVEDLEDKAPERPPASDGSCPPAAVRRKSTSLEPQHLISISKIQDLPLPSREIADQLVNIYFKYVQTIFPYLHEPSFRQYYNTIWEKEQQPDKDIDSLQYCILYLVFALGCQFSTLFEDPIQGGDTYLNRAKSLLGFCVFDDGSVRVVQALLLMGVYLQSTSRPNRCWNVVGMAIRVAQGIKLHVETTAEHLVEREIRRRAWWGCVLMDRLLAMLFGRPLMIHGDDAHGVEAPVVQDDQYIEPDSITTQSGPSKMAFFIATCQLYNILGDILGELYAPGDDYRVMREEDWLRKVSLIMRFDKELKTWLSKLPSYLQWGSEDDVPDDIIRQRNVLRARTLNVRNLLYRPSLIFLGQSKFRTESALDLSTTLSCARLCVASAKDTIQLFYNTPFRLTGPFWFNVFFIFTAATALLGNYLCRENGEPVDIQRDWDRAIGYLQCISSKCSFADRCVKVLEAMMFQLYPSRRPEQQLSDSSSDVPRSTAYLSPVDFSSAIATVATTPIAPSSDWNMEDIVWSNMPWDWNLVDEFLMGHEQF